MRLSIARRRPLNNVNDVDLGVHKAITVMAVLLRSARWKGIQKSKPKTKTAAISFADWLEIAGGRVSLIELRLP